MLILKGLLVNIILAVLRWEKKNADEMVGKGVGGATVYKSYDTRVGTGCQEKAKQGMRKELDCHGGTEVTEETKELLEL